MMANVSPSVVVRFGAHSDQGAVRLSNEDAYVVTPPFFAVADGMGGHALGQAAAQAAVSAFAPAPGQEWTTSAELTEFIDAAREAVLRLGSGARPPGTTLAGVGLTLNQGKPCWLIFNVGDSRAYLLREEVLTQITIDHSIRQEQHNRAPRHIITRALGGGVSATLTADQWVVPIHADDMILVCSDGLHTELAEHLMASLMLAVKEPQETAAALTRAAHRAGGRDNITAVVVVADAVSSAAEQPVDRDKR